MLMKVYFFKGNKLITSNTVNQKQKDYCMDFFKEYLSNPEATDLTIDVYKKEDLINIEKNCFLNVKFGEIEVEKLEDLEVEIDVNWLSELDLKSFYTQDEINKILQNREAMANFSPSEKKTLINWEVEENLHLYYSDEEILKINENKEYKNNFVESEEGSEFSYPNIIEDRYLIEISEFSFPHQIPTKTKKVKSGIKKRSVIETIFPIDTITS